LYIGLLQNTYQEGCESATNNKRDIIRKMLDSQMKSAAAKWRSQIASASSLQSLFGNISSFPVATEPAFLEWMKDKSLEFIDNKILSDSVKTRSTIIHRECIQIVPQTVLCHTFGFLATVSGIFRLAEVCHYFQSMSSLCSFRLDLVLLVWSTLNRNDFHIHHVASSHGNEICSRCEGL